METDINTEKVNIFFKERKRYEKLLKNYKDIITQKELMEIIGCSEQFIYNSEKNGELKVYLNKPKRLYTKTHVLDFLASPYFNIKKRNLKNVNL